MLRIIKRNSLFVAILLIAASLRLMGLGTVPYGFANDEVSYIFSGYTIASTGGFDIMGKFLPLSMNLDSSLSPVPVYIIALFIKLFGLSPFVARLPFALMGIGSIVLLYFICKEVFKKERIALFSMLVFSLSSWHIFITRGVWDVISAQFFLLLGLFLFLRGLRKGSILFSLLPFFMGFYSYHATKVFFFFMIIFLIFINKDILLKRKKEFIIFLASVIVIFASFFVVVKTQSVTRQGEITINNQNELLNAKKDTDFERTESDAPEIFKKIESNKGMFFIQKITATYLEAFSIQHLFTRGDGSSIVGYGTFFKGVLYEVDLPFVLIGLIFLATNAMFFVKRKEKLDKDVSHNRKIFYFVVGLILISPIPAAVGAGTTYVIRTFMLTSFLSIPVGVGLYVVFEMLSHLSQRNRLIGIFSIVLLYIFFISRFFYQYYYQFNVFGGEYWNRSSRDLSEFVIHNSSKYDHVVVATGEDKVLLQYAFFSHANAKEFQKAWQTKWPANLGNVTFANNCPSIADFPKIGKNKVLYITPDSCIIPFKSTAKIVDSMEPLRVIWKIYE